MLISISSKLWFTIQGHHLSFKLTVVVICWLLDYSCGSWSLLDARIGSYVDNKFLPALIWFPSIFHGLFVLIIKGIFVDLFALICPRIVVTIVIIYGLLLTYVHPSSLIVLLILRGLLAFEKHRSMLRSVWGMSPQGNLAGHTSRTGTLLLRILGNPPESLRGVNSPSKCGKFVCISCPSSCRLSEIARGAGRRQNVWVIVINLDASATSERTNFICGNFTTFVRQDTCRGRSAHYGCSTLLL